MVILVLFFLFFCLFVFFCFGGGLGGGGGSSSFKCPLTSAFQVKMEEEEKSLAKNVLYAILNEPVDDMR